jgi:hypothetical protein
LALDGALDCGESMFKRNFGGLRADIKERGLIRTVD